MSKLNLEMALGQLIETAEVRVEDLRRWSESNYADDEDHADECADEAKLADFIEECIAVVADHLNDVRAVNS